jgi:predicted dehydrogenase
MAADLPHEVTPLRWGIIGTGGIAATFAADMMLLPDAAVVAVGSRTQATADEFGDRFAIPRRHGSYEALAEDPDVDAVYVATPHPFHAEPALLAIRARKAVLVEKPFTLNSAEARTLIAEARAQHTFLMEAMWTRFLPHVVSVRQLIAEDRLGDVRSFTADFGGYNVEDAEHRAYSPELGGGALLDLGIYPVSFASMLFGTPEVITARSHPAFTGVDSQTAVILDYSGGRQAVLFTTLETRTPNRASINGRKGRIEIDGDFFAPTAFRLFEEHGRTQLYSIAHTGRGLRHQAAEVGRCVHLGLTESPILPLSETLAIMETLDEIRRQIGLRYPSESVIVRDAGSI